MFSEANAKFESELLSLEDDLEEKERDLKQRRVKTDFVRQQHVEVSLTLNLIHSACSLRFGAEFRLSRRSWTMACLSPFVSGRPAPNLPDLTQGPFIVKFAPSSVLLRGAVQSVAKLAEDFAVKVEAIRAKLQDPSGDLQVSVITEFL